MGYIVKHRTQLGKRLLNKPQTVFEFDANGGNIGTVRRFLNEMKIFEHLHFAFLGNPGPFDSIVQIEWLNQEAFCQVKVLFS